MEVPAGALGGLIVPLVTPFDADGAVDADCLVRLAAELLDKGAAGLAALATTGEAHALTGGERDVVIQACAGVCGKRGVPLLVGAGTYDTRTTIERHEALASYAGVTHSLAVVPYYVRPTESAIVDHFRAVAARSPVPLVLYNIPYRTGRGLGAAALLELAEDPNIVGLKQAVGALDTDTLQVLAGNPAGFAVLAGDDAFILPTLLMGGAGAIAASGHVCTSTFAQMLDAGLRGSVLKARELAARLLPLVEALFAEPSPAVIKAVLHRLAGIPTPEVRMPLSAASGGALGAALAALEQAEAGPAALAQ